MSWLINVELIDQSQQLTISLASCLQKSILTGLRFVLEFFALCLSHYLETTTTTMIIDNRSRVLLIIIVCGAHDMIARLYVNVISYRPNYKRFLNAILEQSIVSFQGLSFSLFLCPSNYTAIDLSHDSTDGCPRRRLSIKVMCASPITFCTIGITIIFKRAWRAEWWFHGDDVIPFNC